jgi:hypothetical protein
MFQIKLLKTVFLLFCLAFLSSCSYRNYNIASNKFSHQQDIEVVTESLITNDSYNVWGGIIYANPGYTLAIVTVKLKNSTGNEKQVDFKNFFLINKEHNAKFQTEKIFRSTLVTLPARLVFTLKPNKEVKRKLMFSYPSKKRPEALEIDGEVYSLAYN